MWQILVDYRVGSVLLNQPLLCLFHLPTEQNFIKIMKSPLFNIKNVILAAIIGYALGVVVGLIIIYAGKHYH